MTLKFRQKSFVPNSIQHQKKKSCKRGEPNVGFQARKESSLPVHVVSTVSLKISTRENQKNNYCTSTNTDLQYLDQHIFLIGGSRYRYATLTPKPHNKVPYRQCSFKLNSAKFCSCLLRVESRYGTLPGPLERPFPTLKL